ncbi:small ribosomal subunit protein bS16m [Microcaecilia unicolor]|uniref:Small ribosomal subunit protein bS16m n=1 Tax=Microcaecilia unicolor TaxID=1415580 RepID=A0A6P7WTZ7_9AMPH|nr:28S ribosomal protein S16, mitochondrial [Microcaecilia unicolor]
MVHVTPLLLKRYYGGHVAIRMALSGCTNRPFYRIVAAFNKRARDGKYFEQLGSYDPMPNIYNEKLVSLNFERIAHWIGKGAIPTLPVAKLLGFCGFFPFHPMTITNAERQRKKRELEALRSSQEENTEGQEQEQTVQ